MRLALAAALLAVLGACKRAPGPGEAHEITQQDRDRLELTLQSKSGWKPEAQGRKLAVQLIVENTGLMQGEKPRYRMEIKNVGSEPVTFREPAPSFIKEGSLCGPSGFRLLLAPPAGKEQPLRCDETAKAPAQAAALDLTIAPGDYLITRPEAPARRFRALSTSFSFDKPGPYRLKAVYETDGLRAESNEAAFRVVEKRASKAPRPKAKP